jgi:TPR repeat protein
MLVKTCPIIVLVLIMLSPTAAIADMQEYIREYNHRVGDADNEMTSRQISMHEIKVELLGELGTYINSRIEISQDNKSKTEFNEEITALTAGYVQVDVLEERFDGKTYYLKARLSADPDDVITQINELGKSTPESQQNREKLVQVYQEKIALRALLASLQDGIDLNKAAGKETQSLVEQYLKESQKLSGAASYELGIDHYYGLKGKSKDYTQAVSWYRKAAEQGYLAAQFNLGHMYQEGYGVSKDFGLAVYWYRKAAEQDLRQAQYNLGFMYLNGYGVSKDVSQAMSWYRKAAEQDLGEAQHNLGGMYEHGIGVSKDHRQAISWYLKAAEQGFAEAQYNVGLMYQQGKGVSQDSSLALSWWEKSAEQGFANAQYALGIMYKEGYGVSKDARLAVSWYNKAAEQDLAEAQYALGVMYHSGSGVTKDVNHAISLFRKAAEQGHANAQIVLKRIL